MSRRSLLFEAGRKTVQIGQTEPKGLPEGVQKYAER